MKMLFAATLLALPLIGTSQNYDSTGTNRLFVQAQRYDAGGTEIPGKGTFQDGAVVASYSVVYNDATTYWVCVVKKGASGGNPVWNSLGPVCPVNTTPFVTGGGFKPEVQHPWIQ